MTMRHNDPKDMLHFRSDRIACENGLFYFTTREGGSRGPFKSRDQAEIAASIYVRDQLPSVKLASTSKTDEVSLNRHGGRAVLDRRATERRTSERRQHWR